MMTERYTYIITVESRRGPGIATAVEELIEQIAASTRSSYTCSISYVCADCGCEWSEKRCRPCETLRRAEGRE
jgi:hypothetical protein